MKQTLSLVLFIIFLFTLACHPARKLQTVGAKKDTTNTIDTTKVLVVKDSKADSIKLVQDVFEKVRNSKIDFKTFSAKMKVDYTDKNGGGPELTVFVRMQKDSLIWLSINATVFSYEAFRVLITHDSVIVMNKKDKQVQLRSFGYLQELTQLPFDFSTVQDLILGNPVYLDSNIVSFKQNETSVSLLSSGKFFKNLMTLGKDDYVLQHSRLDDVSANRNRTCDLNYSDYENKDARLFSTERKINVSEKSKLDIDMNIKQYSFNEILSYPFAIPKNYKRN